MPSEVEKEREVAREALMRIQGNAASTKSTPMSKGETNSSTVSYDLTAAFIVPKIEHEQI
jgi:hypothetical protein